jgi:hypothetical protein
VNNPACSPYAESFTPLPEKQRRPARSRCQDRSAGGQPAAHGVQPGVADRDGALLAALAEEPDHAAAEIDVVDVQRAQLRYPRAGAVQDLDHGQIPRRERPGDRLFSGLVEPVGGLREHRSGLPFGEHARQRPVQSRTGQPKTRIDL